MKQSTSHAGLQHRHAGPQLASVRMHPPPTRRAPISAWLTTTRGTQHHATSCTRLLLPPSVPYPCATPMRPIGCIPMAHAWSRTPWQQGARHQLRSCKTSAASEGEAAPSSKGPELGDGIVKLGDGIQSAVGGGGGSSGAGGGLPSGGDDHAHGNEPPHGPHLSPVTILLLTYAGFLLWVELCAHGLDQYLDHHIHTLPGADQWKVTIIIPALNEEKGLGDTLRWLRANLDGGRDVEIIVVDGGSEDRTVRVAWEGGASRVVRSSRRGRAAQMNAGAAHASGELLAFLHADTLPPTELPAVLRDEFSDPRTVLLAFNTCIQGSDGQPLQWMTAHHSFKTWLYPLLLRPMEYLTGLRLVFGDQVMCCRKTDFEAVGGFNATLPIMEDADLCRRLHAHGPAPQYVRTRHTKLAVKGRMHGRIKQIENHTSVTSGRRLEAWGDIKGTWIHFRIALAWWFGASGDELGKLYRDLYTDNYR